MNSWNSLEAYVVVGLGVSCGVGSGVSGLVVGLVGGHSGDQEGDNDELNIPFKYYISLEAEA